MLYGEDRKHAYIVSQNTAVVSLLALCAEFESVKQQLCIAELGRNTQSGSTTRNYNHQGCADISYVPKLISAVCMVTV